MNNYAVPIAIVVAGLLIAGAVFFTQNSTPSTTGTDTEKVKLVNPVTSADYIKGSPDAKIVVIEYSDIDCPFCKQFHTTMQKIVDEYGKDGDVSWVYRHFPLTSLHPNAARHAEAAECAGNIGGNDGFWKFLDAMIAANPPGQNADPVNYPTYATSAGLSADALTQCIAKGDMKKNVDEDYNNALATGGTGTPYSILIIKGAKEPIAISGALPYEQIKAAIDSSLAQ